MTLPMKIMCAILRAFYISCVDSSRVNVCAWQCIVHGGLGGESSNGRTLWRGNSAVKQKAHSVQVMWKSIDLCYATAFVMVVACAAGRWLQRHHRGRAQACNVVQ